MDLTSFQLISFDCYGTLVDWETGILTALRNLLSPKGIKPSDDDILDLYANVEHEAEAPPEYRSYREILGQVVEAFAQRYDFTPSAREHDCLADSMERWKPFADTADALRILKKRYKLAVLSNVDNDLFAPTRSALGTDLDFVVTAELCRSYKPEPKHWRVLRALSGLDKSKILHVAESRYHDIVPAKAMGISTAWVNRRAGKGGGASEGSTSLPGFDAIPDLEVPDLATLARLCEAEWKRKRF